MTIIRPSVTYGCEVWPAPLLLENKLLAFENKILKRKCGQVFDSEHNIWHRRKNAELRKITITKQVHYKSQRLQWFGHAMQKTENTNVRAAIVWPPRGKRPREWPKKR